MRKDEIATLIRYRLDQAQIALEDAKYLLDGKRSFQSIINRSYYAMFYAALALLQKIGKIPSKHTGVISIFDTEFALKGVLPKELSKHFHKAFELRQISDYKVTETSSYEKAEEIYTKASSFVKTVKDYLLPLENVLEQ
ncbi:MAG: HEPN domain-containing protein [Candidatus Tectomicrobia bacterium]|uniref:HEPN domain-containing protein n=1 Tax=Tectimicrobiota bacterium TaxID=2528274 RepID=A0A933LPK8_UNCTE|nr:HEPN domain-containing protein [Candidatus Tectomicrobia bacterium]